MRLAPTDDEERCELTVGTLRERLVAAGKPAFQLSPRALSKRCGGWPATPWFACRAGSRGVTTKTSSCRR